MSPSSPSVSFVILATPSLVQLLSCVVLKSQSGEHDAIEVVLAIPHRKGRLPVKLMASDFAEQRAPAWRCSDGALEQIAVAQEHSDIPKLWEQILGNGLLVSEFKESIDSNSSENPHLDLFPVGHWILDKQGSTGWVLEESVF